MSRSLVQLTLARFREFWREPEAIFWVFAFPVLLTLGLGIAFRQGPEPKLNIGVSDTELASALQAEKGLSVRVLNSERAEDALVRGRVVLLIRRDGQRVLYRFDDTNPEARTAQLLAERALRRATGAADPIQGSSEIVHQPGSRYIDFVVPGLLGMNLMSSAIWGIGFGIVDARRKKLLRRLVVTPMPRWEYLASFLLSRLVMLFLQISFLLGFALLFFQVPLRGSALELALLCLLASLCFSAIGLLIASRARTVEGASGLINLTMLPMWILSGVFFSAERYPEPILPLIRALPLTAVLDAMRGIMLHGSSLYTMAGPLLVITAWLAVGFAVALRMFRWQ